MPYGIDNETEEWFKGLEKKLYAKLKTQCLRLGSIMPYVPEHGCYYDMGARELTAWTNGFMPVCCGRCITHLKRKSSAGPQRDRGAPGRYP